MKTLNLNKIHSDWQVLVKTALRTMETSYLDQLKSQAEQSNWLPGPDNIFNAFQLPLSKTRYILFGESPYPRAKSANGYAFWDGAANELWSDTGLSKTVNRATSLRNIIKTLLVAAGKLTLNDTSQAAIATVDKTQLVKTMDELFGNFQQHGILLLNASLVLSQNAVKKDAKYWLVFIAKLLEQLCEQRPDIQLILWGNIAKTISSIPAAATFQQFKAEHPYNISFISNPNVLEFFKPLDLLHRPSSSAKAEDQTQLSSFKPFTLEKCL